MLLYKCLKTQRSIIMALTRRMLLLCAGVVVLLFEQQIINRTMERRKKMLLQEQSRQRRRGKIRRSSRQLTRRHAVSHSISRLYVLESRYLVLAMRPLCDIMQPCDLTLTDAQQHDLKHDVTRRNTCCCETTRCGLRPQRSHRHPARHFCRHTFLAGSHRPAENGAR